MLDDLIGWQDAHLERQQQRGEDQPKGKGGKAQAEINDAIGGHHRNDDLAQRKADAQNQRVLEHVETGILTGKAGRAEQGLVEILVKLVADGQAGAVFQHIDVGHGGHLQHHQQRHDHQERAENQDAVIDNGAQFDEAFADLWRCAYGRFSMVSHDTPLRCNGCAAR